MKVEKLKCVILGLSITSSWGNGHATNYRALCKALAARGHSALFLERNVPWYAANRDLQKQDGCEIGIYESLDELKDRYSKEVKEADFVMVGSYTPEGIAVGDWVTTISNGVTAFYDIDTPVTLKKLAHGSNQYLSTELITRYQLYLSFTGGPILERLQTTYQAAMARPLYCCVDPDLYYPEELEVKWDLGYLGTYSLDRQPALKRLLLEPATRWSKGRFIVAGSQYPPSVIWPDNVTRVTHLPAAQHREFYNQQLFALNITRRDMIEAGFSPSVRLFEAAACGIPVISDSWNGLNCFFEPDSEILVARTSSDCLQYLLGMSDADRKAIGKAARARALKNHTAAQRVAELESYVAQLTRTTV